MKKASSEMWWIIIGAVIALVVLVVVILIFTGRINPLSQSVSGCESKGGVCAPSEVQCPDLTLETTAFDCNGGQTCCLGTPKSCTEDENCGKGKICETRYNDGKKGYCLSQP